MAERPGTIVLSSLVAHTAWHWMADRAGRLRQFSFEWPTLDAAWLAGLTRWLLLAAVAAGLAWLVFGVLLRAGERAGGVHDDAESAGRSEAAGGSR